MLYLCVNFCEMTQLILNSDIDKTKLEVLRKLFESWNLKFEVKKTSVEKKSTDKKISFFDGAGIWADYDIDADKLRKQAWKRGK